MSVNFPIYPADKIFNRYSKKNNTTFSPQASEIEIMYPCRLALMPLDPLGLTKHNNMIFKSGEVNFSVNLFIKVQIKLLNNPNKEVIISENTKRKALVKHAYYLMCDALNISPSVYIDVDESSIPVHCGLGSTSSLIMSICAGINELYGNPISKEELIKYTTSNHGEEVSNDDYNNLKAIPCIGGGASSGMVNAGIIIISGHATVISQIPFNADITICVPKEIDIKPNDDLMNAEEASFSAFIELGKKYGKSIAYEFLHNIIPDLTNGNIRSLADMVFNYRFNMGVIDSYALVYPEIKEISKKLRCLYEDGHCALLSLSSVGPAFFTLTTNEKDKNTCINKMKSLNMKIIETSFCNKGYSIRTMG